MIFVTVGSWGFNSLVKAADDLGDAITSELIIQIANGSYKPVNCEYFKTASSLDPYYDNATLVIAHGGTGTTLEVLAKGVPLVSISNPSVKDNHQHEFLLALHKVDALNYCEDLSELEEIVKRTQKRTEHFDVSIFFNGFTADIDSYQPERKSSMTKAIRNLFKKTPTLKSKEIELSQIKNC